MSYVSICSQNCQDYCFIVLDICLALATAQAKKHRHCSGHNHSKDKLNTPWEITSFFFFKSSHLPSLQSVATRVTRGIKDLRDILCFRLNYWLD